MKFQDVFDLNISLFNQPVFNDSEWFLGGGDNPTKPKSVYLELNAKVENGKNKYKEFIKEEFYNPLSKILGIKTGVNAFTPRICFGLDEKTGKTTRSITFSYLIFLIENLYSLEIAEEQRGDFIIEFIDFAAEDANKLELLDKCKKYNKLELKCYRDVLEKGNESPYYEKTWNLYKHYVKVLGNMPFKNFLNSRIEAITRFNIYGKECIEIFEREINTDKLLDAFEYDKFALIAAYSILNQSRITVERTGKVDSAIIYVRNYVSAVQEYRKYDKSYNPFIYVYNDKDEKVKVTTEQIIKEYNRVLMEHNEFSVYTVYLDDLKKLLTLDGMSEEQQSTIDFSTEEGAQLLTSIVNRLKSRQELAASWQLLPQGKKEDTAKHEHDINKIYESLTSDEAIRRRVIGREFLENNAELPYIYRLRGINNFSGYIGYIYANGSVVFEQYYENENTHKVVRSGATYIMNIFNFIQMSILSKTEIINLLQHDKSQDITRVYHRKDMDKWKNEIYTILTNKQYTKDVKAMIEFLIQNGILNQNNLQK